MLSEYNTLVRFECLDSNLLSRRSYSPVHLLLSSTGRRPIFATIRLTLLPPPYQLPFPPSIVFGCLVICNKRSLMFHKYRVFTECDRVGLQDSRATPHPTTNKLVRSTSQDRGFPTDSKCLYFQPRTNHTPMHRCGHPAVVNLASGRRWWLLLDCSDLCVASVASGRCNRHRNRIRPLANLSSLRT